MSFSTLKVNEPGEQEKEKIKIVKAYNSNPHKSIVNSFSKAKGNTLHRNSSDGFIPNIKTQMFLESLTQDEFNLNKNYLRWILDIFNAINNIPKPNSLVYILSKSELSITTQIYNNSTNLLNLFNARLKKYNDADALYHKQQPLVVNLQKKANLENNYNYIGKPRHYPPANKE